MLFRALLAGFLTVSLLTAQTPPETDALEARLENNPDDLPTRTQILRFATFSTMPAERSKALRRKHLLWLIEHKPTATALGENFAVIEKSGGPLADPDAWKEADRLWRAQLTGTPPQETFANAVNFYRSSDPAFARKLLDDGLAAYPGSSRLSAARGNLLGLILLGVKQVDRFGQATSFDDGVAKSEDAARARRELAAAQSAQTLGTAAETLSLQVSALQARNRAAEVASTVALTESLFQLALELEPANVRWKNGLATLYWTSASRKPTQAEKVALLEKALRMSGDASPHGYVLSDLAQAYLASGDTAKAADTARELLALPKSNPNYGGAVHNGNIVLGRLAIKKGDVEEAKRRLLAAGETPGSPVLGSFGPNWNLAQELLAAGERDTVLAYIELCRKFWKSERGRLDTWASAIRDGNSPNFFGGPPIKAPNLAGLPVPEFRLRNLKGGEVTSSELKGKVVLLDFWATWCAPCRAEMPTFEKLHREFASKGVVILAVDVNEADDVVREYIEKEKFTFPVLLSQGTDVVSRFGVEAYPTLVAIDKYGVVSDYLIGGRSEENLRQVVERARTGAALPRASIVAAVPSTVPPPQPRPAGLAPPATAEDFYREGVRLHGAKDLAGAIKALDSAIQRNARMAIAWELRAHCNAEMHHLPEAIADSTRSIELFPYSAVAFHERGLAYLNSGTLDEALSDLNRALAINPAMTVALQSRVRLYMARKQYGEAIADCDAALRSNPSATWAVQRRNEARTLMAGGVPPAGELTPPKLLSPAAGATFSHFPRETTLVWSELPGAASYVVEWDYKGVDAWASEQRGGPGVILHAAKPTVSFAFVGAQPGRWRVWALDANGTEGAKSEWREFAYTR